MEKNNRFCINISMTKYFNYIDKEKNYDKIIIGIKFHKKGSECYRNKFLKIKKRQNLSDLSN